ncbi:MAG: hypothetical protein U9R51_10810 [Actinomycetota bacterium]|nr:hypothetical protein [Actinomycetota bacterium]
MKKIFVSIAAAGVLVAGAFAASTIVDGQATAQAIDEPAVERPDIPKPGDILDEVLADLVADDTLAQGEAEAVKAALEARHEEVRAQLDEWRENNPGRAERDAAMDGMLEDGVIDADELAQLPDDHPFNDPDGPAAEFLDDGELSADDLRELGDHRRAPHGGDRRPTRDADRTASTDA